MGTTSGDEPLRRDMFTGPTGSGPPTGYAEPSTARTVLVTSTAALGGFLFGYDTAVINGAVKAVGQAYAASPFVLGLAVAAALIGCAIGAWFAGEIADHYGRIRVMSFAAIAFAVSALGSGLSFSIWDLAFWRLVGGLGVGAASVIAPAYIAEISPARIRGRLGSLQQLAIVTGIFVALLVDYALVAGSGGAADPLWFGLATWRWMFLSLLIPAIAYGLLTLSIPESPRYLVARERFDKAAQVLRRFVGGDVDEKIREIVQTLRGRQARQFRGHPRHGAGTSADRLGRHRTVGFPAVHRHQRDFLLLVGAVAVRRIQRAERTDHHGDHLGDEHPHHDHRHLTGRPGRPQAAAARRLDRTVRLPGRARVPLRHRARHQRRPEPGFVRDDRARGRQPLRRVLRRDLGTGGLGHAR
jgi:hypothetical protein